MGDVFLRQLTARRRSVRVPASHPVHPQIALGVCGGAGCCQRGGDAACVELEELCSEATFRQGGARKSAPAISVERIGCSHQCDLAPLVQVLINPRSTSESRHSVRMESADGPAQCKRIVFNALDAYEPDLSPERSGVDGLMQRRAANMRWEALRVLARSTSQNGKARREGLKLLDDAIEADIRAAGGDEARLERASRRAARLRARFEPSAPGA
jgi:hypothetical protein